MPRNWALLLITSAVQVSLATSWGIAPQQSVETRAADATKVEADTVPRTASASEVVDGYVSDLKLPHEILDAMHAALRLHPQDTNWGGSAGDKVFALVASPLVGQAARNQSIPASLQHARATAVNALLVTTALSQIYADAGLTDMGTLRVAAQRVSGGLAVSGAIKNMEDGAVVRGGLAVAYIVVDSKNLNAEIQDPATLDLIKEAYRDVMHAQARDLMARGKWADALLLWQHLHERHLVSQMLYLDAATCFHELGRDSEALNVLSEAIKAFSKTATTEFLERAGDLAVQIRSDDAQQLAERAYRSASEKLLSTTTTGPLQNAEPLPK